MIEKIIKLGKKIIFMDDSNLEEKVRNALPGWMAGGGAGFMSIAPFYSWHETGRWLREMHQDRSYFTAGYYFGQVSGFGVYCLAAYLLYDTVS